MPNSYWLDDEVIGCNYLESSWEPLTSKHLTGSPTLYILFIKLANPTGPESQLFIHPHRTTPHHNLEQAMDDIINWDDVDHIFHNLGDDDDHLFTVNDSSSPTFQEIEQLLMNDDDVADLASSEDADSQFATDWLVDSPAHSPSAEEALGFLDSKGDEDKDKVSHQLYNDVPLDKKRKRQLRNRDAAVRSRERKKLYVRDLELKSRYYESECKRLGFVLQCCVAENQALRFSLQNSSANGVSMTKQESAVLLLESLLLGSLLWFLGITCLLILPSQTWSIPEENQGSRNHGLLVPIKEGKKTSRMLAFLSFMMGKRCKASRSRMKLNPHSLGIVM